MSYTQPPTRSSLEFLDEDDWNADVADTREFCHKPPSARGYRDAVQTLTTSTLTDVIFDNESHDTDTMHDNSTNNTRLTATTAGVYLVSGVVQFNASTTGNRWVAINKGGSNVYIELRPAPSTVGNMTVSAVIKLAAAEYVELEVWQNTGSDLDVLAAATIRPALTMTWIGSGA